MNDKGLWLILEGLLCLYLWARRIRSEAMEPSLTRAVLVICAVIFWGWSFWEWMNN